MRLSIRECANLAGARFDGKDAILTRISTDSRACAPGDLFVCIKGERSDGHDFARNAQELGATAILAEKELSDLQIPVLVVPDSIKALDQIALGWRGKFAGKVIALTGTAGKTTLKDALAAILTQAGKVRATEKNYNNQLGVALTILGADGDEDFWLLEAGISHAHDMDELGNTIRPDLAILLNADKGHSAGLGERGVAWHKAQLCKWLAENGIALVNADYPKLLAEALKFGRKYYFFGSKKRNGCHFLLNAEKGPGLYEILSFNGDTSCFKTPYEDEWGGEISVAAVAAAKVLGLSPDQINKGFSNCSMPQGRMNRLHLGGHVIFDDSYNANPLSMRRMLKSAAAKAQQLGLPLIAVLGEMGELGKDARECHRQLGSVLSGLGAAHVIWKGDFADLIKDALFKTGNVSTQFHKIEDVEDFRQLLEMLHNQALFPAKSVILFKGSRFNLMEEFVGAFREFLETGSANNARDK